MNRSHQDSIKSETPRCLDLLFGSMKLVHFWEGMLMDGTAQWCLEFFKFINIYSKMEIGAGSYGKYSLCNLYKGKLNGENMNTASTAIKLAKQGFKTCFVYR